MKLTLSKKQLFYIIFLALLSAAAVYFLIPLVSSHEKAAEVFFGSDIVKILFVLIAFVCFFLFYRRGFFSEKLKSPGVYSIILAALFSCFTVFGESFAAFKSWAFVFSGSLSGTLIAIICLLGCFVFYYCFLKYIFSWLEQPVKQINPHSRFLIWMESHFFLFSFIVIFLAWLPYLIVYLPGNCPYDGYYQISVAAGSKNLWDNYPVASTVFLGFLFSIGRHISDNFGVFFTVFVQYIACSLIYAFVCKRIREMCGYSWVPLFSLAFYAFVPMWGMYATTLIKDTFSYAFFTLFVLSAIQLIKHFKSPSSKDFLFFFCMGLLMTLIRHHFLYIILPAAVLLVFVLKKSKIKMAVVAVSIFVIFMLYSECLLPALNIHSANPRESKSIIFQQVSRYVDEYDEELTSEEKQIIDNVLDYNLIKEKYNPEVSDYVKNTFKLHSTKEESDEFISLWKKMIAKHPGTCIQATLNNSFGYFDPFYVQTNMRSYQYYMKGNFNISDDPLEISYVLSEDTRNVLSQYSKIWQHIPIISFFSNPGFYAWALLLFIAVLLKKKRWIALPAFIAPLFYLLGLIGSPVNGLLRYAMILIAPIPLLLAFCIRMSNRPSSEL